MDEKGETTALTADDEDTGGGFDFDAMLEELQEVVRDAAQHAARERIVWHLLRKSTDPLKVLQDVLYAALKVAMDLDTLDEMDATPLGAALHDAQRVALKTVLKAIRDVKLDETLPDEALKTVMNTVLEAARETARGAARETAREAARETAREVARETAREVARETAREGSWESAEAAWERTWEGVLTLAEAIAVSIVDAALDGALKEIREAKKKKQERGGGLFNVLAALFLLC